MRVSQFATTMPTSAAPADIGAHGNQRHAPSLKIWFAATAPATAIHTQRPTQGALGALAGSVAAFLVMPGG